MEAAKTDKLNMREVDRNNYEKSIALISNINCIKDTKYDSAAEFSNKISNLEEQITSNDDAYIFFDKHETKNYIEFVGFKIYYYLIAIYIYISTYIGSAYLFPNILWNFQAVTLVHLLLGLFGWTLVSLANSIQLVFIKNKDDQKNLEFSCFMSKKSSKTENFNLDLIEDKLKECEDNLEYDYRNYDIPCHKQSGYLYMGPLNYFQKLLLTFVGYTTTYTLKCNGILPNIRNYIAKIYTIESLKPDNSNMTTSESRKYDIMLEDNGDMRFRTYVNGLDLIKLCNEKNLSQEIEYRELCTSSDIYMNYAKALSALGLISIPANINNDKLLLQYLLNKQNVLENYMFSQDKFNETVEKYKHLLTEDEQLYDLIPKVNLIIDRIIKFIKIGETHKYIKLLDDTLSDQNKLLNKSENESDDVSEINL